MASNNDADSIDIVEDLRRASRQSQTGNKNNYEVKGTCCEKIIKILLSLLMFVVILSCTMISQGTLLYAASNVYDTHAAQHDETLPWENPSFPLVCLDYTTIISKNISEDHTNCVTMATPYSNASVENLDITMSCLWPQSTSDKVKPRGGSSTYIANMCRYSSLQWFWCLFLMQSIPYAFKFLKCLWSILFRKRESLKFGYLTVVLLIESLHSFGISMFLFNVLPHLDNIFEACVLMPAVAFVPSFLTVVRKFLKLVRKRNKKVSKYVHFLIHVLALLAQLSVIILWPVLIATGNRSGHENLKFTLPVSLILISLIWWQNYIENSKVDNNEESSFIKNLKDSKETIHCIVYGWKLILCVAFVPIVLLVDDHDTSISELLTFSFSDCKDSVWNQPQIGTQEIPSIGSNWLWLCLINVLCGWCAYFAARSAAKAKLQRFSYAFPMMLSSPLAMIFLFGQCHLWKDSPCSYVGPTYYFFKCHSSDLYSVFVDQHLYMFIVSWISQIWITRHIWYPKNERLANASKLFINLPFDGIFLEQSLLHNRNRKDHLDNSPTNATMYQNLVDPTIYLCATMWHETKGEMINLLKSVCRMDVDHHARKIYKEKNEEHPELKDPDFYEFEAHIFFDDAMCSKECDGGSGEKMEVNKYVEDLVKAVNEAKKNIYNDDDDDVLVPIKYNTPYGGRLEWTLPFESKVIAHLKDKKKIRIKKRWSQVMYMNYLLKNKLIPDLTDEKEKKQAMKFNNTFLLALDGDVDFQPKAVTLLVDLMKRNARLAAACGRIHPTGSGPLVWYQKFEYAIGHWMQKATEDVLGCVLCSPGCFSLFRGTALLDGIMDTYATQSEQAKDFVQYDQGEDRWLCTLLLQKGYTVEYCAASDAYTAAPETFKEFYNQRRRWGPSTVANIIDLIKSWKATTKENDSLSLLYIVYQLMFLFLSLLGPGIIFLMMAGALDVVLKEMVEMWTPFIINLIPLIIFIIIWFALILTAIYTIVQMIVIVSFCIQMVQKGTCSPTFIFFFYIAGTLLLAAILHPQEFSCIFYSFIYFLAIPSMYMLLVIYSMCNLHVTSWGTREKETTPEDPEQKLLVGQEDNGLWSMGLTEEGFTIGFGNCFRCICCPRREKVNPRSVAFQDQVEASDLTSRRESSESPARPKHSELGDRPAIELDTKEVEFFEQLISDVLYPLDHSKEEQQEVHQELKELRNSAAGAFLMLNAMFVVFISVLQLNIDTLAVPWPCGSKQLSLEPIGLMLLVLFTSIMLLQTFGMLVHRGGTLLHTAATTSLKKSQQLDIKEALEKIRNDAIKEISKVPETDIIASNTLDQQKQPLMTETLSILTKTMVIAARKKRRFQESKLAAIDC